MNTLDLKLRVSVHKNGVVNVETRDEVMAFIPSRNVPLARIFAAAPDMELFVRKVARSICLDQQIGTACACFSCEAKRLLRKNHL